MIGLLRNTHTKQSNIYLARTTNQSGSMIQVLVSITCLNELESGSTSRSGMIILELIPFTMSRADLCNIEKCKRLDLLDNPQCMNDIGLKKMSAILQNDRVPVNRDACPTKLLMRSNNN